MIARFLSPLLLMAAAAAQAPVLRAPDEAAPLAAKWAWALKQAPAKGEFFIGYEIEAQLEEGFLLLSGHGWLSGAVHFDGLSMDSLLAGVTPAAGRGQRVHKVAKRLALVFPIAAGTPGELHVSNMELPTGIGHGQLAWLGRATTADSYRLLADIYEKTEPYRERGRLIEAIGYHDLDQATNFLAEIRASKARRDLRKEAVAALARQSAARAADMLIESALREPDGEVRVEAVAALKNLASDRALTTLITLANGNHPHDVRAEAVQGLGEIGDNKSMSTLHSLLDKERDEHVVVEVIEALSDYRDEFDRIATVARRHANTEVREKAIETLVDMNPPLALPIVKQIITDGKDPEMVAIAVNALADVPEEEALPLLQAIAKEHRFKEVRLQAIETLSEFADEPVLAQLKKLVWDDPDPEIQEAAAAGIGEMEGPDSLKLLLAIAKKHPAEDVRERALDCLKDRAMK